MGSGETVPNAAETSAADYAANPRQIKGFLNIRVLRGRFAKTVDPETGRSALLEEMLVAGLKRPVPLSGVFATPPLAETY